MTKRRGANRMVAQRQANSAKVCRWFGFWTGVVTDQRENWCAQWRSSAQLRSGIEGERFEHRQRTGAAHLGHTVRCHSLTGFVGQLDRLGQSHHLSAFGGHLPCGDSAISYFDGSGPGKRRFLAKQAKQRSSEHQQGKPSGHSCQLIAGGLFQVNSFMKPAWLQQVANPSHLPD